MRRTILMGAVACLLAVAAVPATSHGNEDAAPDSQPRMDPAAWSEVARGLEGVVDPRALLGAEVTSTELEGRLTELGWTVAEYRATAHAALDALQTQYDSPAAPLTELAGEFPLPEGVTVPWVAPPASPDTTSLGTDLELVRRLLGRSRGSWDEEDDSP